MGRITLKKREGAIRLQFNLKGRFTYITKNIFSHLPLVGSNHADTLDLFAQILRCLFVAVTVQ